jgi:hypothetical protein
MSADPVRGEHSVDTIDDNEPVPHRLSRRRALQLAAAGAAGIGASGLAGVGLAGRASAEIKLPTLTVQPTPEDRGVLAFLTSLERAALAGYETVTASGKASAEAAAVLAAFGEHHRQHATAYAALAGTAASSTPNKTLVSESTKSFGNPLSLSDSYTALLDMEERLVATAQVALGRLVGTAGSARVASVIVIDTRHAVVLAQLARVDDAVPTFETTTKAYGPVDYPVE